MGRFIVRACRSALQAISLEINKVLSWAGWVPILLIGSFTGVWLHQSDLVMLILTIQTSVDAAATKGVQNDLREADEAKISAIQRQGDILIDMMNAAKRRDELAAKRDKMILTALENRNDLLEILGKEVYAKREQRKIRKSSSRKRASNGRSTRKKS